MATKSIYSDINERYIKDGQGDIKLSLNGQAVKTSLTNILLTRRGARCMRPDFGCSLDSILFENFSQDVADRISAMIKREVTRWDPRIQLRNIVYEPDVNNGTVDMTVFFSVKGDDSVMDLTIPIGKG